MEDQRSGFLHQILPPRLEDAGLEDCALPPDSIREAFLKAATAVKSRAAAILAPSDDEDEGCVGDPFPDAGGRSDAVVVGGAPEAKGATAESGGADVVAIGGGEGEKDCVDGLRGLEIGDEKVKKNGGCDDEEDDEEKPILVGGYV